ncbi:MAG: RNB domain-containing ribonuclease [Clostridium sp.]|nr:MAG: RNB domain-containing ribonuclease [Clostridium sp.]
MQKARYSPEAKGHFGLGLKAHDRDYTHFTSPIRRMCDLLVHTIFRVFIIEKKILVLKILVSGLHI